MVTASEAYRQKGENMAHNLWLADNTVELAMSR